MSLPDLYAKYHDDVQFIVIYIREAHPVDGWWLGKGSIGFWLKLSRSKVALDIYDPKTIEERRLAAGQFETSLKYGVRTYVDEMDDAVNTAYAAAPTRMYLIGLDGCVVYRGGMGPYGFKPKELGAAIKKYLSQIDSNTGY